MRRLSSTSTVLLKRVFPAVWFGILGVAAVVLCVVMAVKGEFQFQVLIAPVMAAVGYFVMKHTVFDLVDEVWDQGDALIVRNRGIEARIDLRDIVHVSDTRFTRPPRITLVLREPSLFGKEIVFVPPERVFRLPNHPIVTELTQRIDATRRPA